MALIIGERVQDSLERARWRATDSATSQPVGVNISHEALADNGETACLDKAQEKYDGAASSVDVTTSDF
jgi:hypothetical protein